MKTTHNMHSFDRKRGEEDSYTSCYYLEEGRTQNNSYYCAFGLEVEAGYYMVDNDADLGFASGYSLDNVFDSKVVDEALDAVDSLEDFAVMDEVSFVEDSLDNFHLDDGLALAVVDNLGNSSSQNCNEKTI